jgi:hypothetical protein
MGRMIWQMNPQYTLIKKENSFMSEPKEEVKTEEKEPPVKNISINEVFSQYPIDRDKARDVLFMEISSSLLKIAQSLEALPQALLGISQKLENLNKKRVGPG